MSKIVTCKKAINGLVLVLVLAILITVPLGIVYFFTGESFVDDLQNTKGQVVETVTQPTATLAPSATPVAQEAVVEVAPTTTSVATIVPEAVEPTATPKMIEWTISINIRNCHVTTIIHEIDDDCGEDAAVDVYWDRVYPPLVIKQEDPETESIVFTQHLWDSLQTSQKTFQMSEFTVTIHVDDQIGYELPNQELPEFGPENGTFAVEVEFPEKVFNDTADEIGTQFFSILHEGDVVEIVHVRAPDYDNGEIVTNIHHYYFTVLDGWVTWLEPKVDDGFQRLGVSLYVEPTSCGESGTCHSIFTHTPNEEGDIFAWSAGSHGRGIRIPQENIRTFYEGSLVSKLRIPEVLTVR